MRPRTTIVLSVAVVGLFVAASAYAYHLYMAGPKPIPAVDPLLREAHVSLYPSAPARTRPRAFVFFFGDDAGFWRPHREMAAILAQRGFAVAGYDIRRLLLSMPADSAARERRVISTMGPLIRQARHELGADRVPVIIAGHSLGAELAIWIAANMSLPDVIGVLALSPGGRTHLEISFTDIANRGDPSGASTYSVADEIRAVPIKERIALVRGSADRFAVVDSALTAAGGDRFRRFLVPLAAHSFRRVVWVRASLVKAAEWLLEANDSAHH